MRYLFLLLIIFIILAFASFYKAIEFSILKYTLSPISLIVIIGAIFYGMFYIYFNNDKDSIKNKKEIIEISAIHAIGSFFLYFIGAYSLLIFLQFIFGFLLLKKINNFIFGFFLYLQNLILITLFSSEYYLFYFIYLTIIIFLFWRQIEHYKEMILWKYCLAILSIIAFVFVYQEILFDIYIWSTIEVVSYNIDKSVLFILTNLHILMIFSINYIKPKRFKKN